MTIQKKYTISTSLVIGVISMVSMVVPVFATSNEWSYPYSCGDAVPNGWSSDNNAYANEDYSTGYSYVYAQASSGTEQAVTDMDYDSGSLCDTSEQLTTSASTIYWGYDTSYIVSISNQGSGTTQYTGGANLYDSTGGSFSFYDSCVFTITSSASSESSQVCNDSNGSGSLTFATEAINEAYATGPLSGTNIVDAKNSGNEALVNWLKLCDQSC